ncbi:hypothetical protein ES708_30073 [subsurface metagenome]
MKCPLFYSAVFSKPGEYAPKAIECLQEECAWWDGHGGFCSIIKIVRHLEMVAPILHDIADELALIRPPAK